MTLDLNHNGPLIRGLHRAILASIRNDKPEEADIAMQTVLRGSQRDLEHALRPPTPSRASGQEKKKSNGRKRS
jgi:hypothetical protein